LTRANWPGTQAAAEKSSLMTAGALMGTRRFSGVGGLSLDEVFSAEQFLIDCEIRDHVQRLVDGLTFGDEMYDWVKEVQAGVEDSFLAVDSTVARYRQVYWFPQLFDRGPWAGPGHDQTARRREYAKAVVRQRIAQHDYELDSHKRQEIYHVWRHAVEECDQGVSL
jgi:trimethylamine:corrinoid methyltransferase-like protein